MSSDESQAIQAIIVYACNHMLPDLEAINGLIIPAKKPSVFKRIKRAFSMDSKPKSTRRVSPDFCPSCAAFLRGSRTETHAPGQPASRIPRPQAPALTLEVPTATGAVELRSQPPSPDARPRQVRIAIPSDPQPARIAIPSSPQPARIAIPSDPQPARIAIPSDPQPARIALPSDRRPARIALPSDRRPARIGLPSSPRPVRTGLPSSRELTEGWEARGLGEQQPDPEHAHPASEGERRFYRLGQISMEFPRLRRSRTMEPRAQWFDDSPLDPEMSGPELIRRYLEFARQREGLLPSLSPPDVIVVTSYGSGSLEAYRERTHGPPTPFTTRRGALTPAQAPQLEGQAPQLPEIRIHSPFDVDLSSIESASPLNPKDGEEKLEEKKEEEGKKEGEEEKKPSRPS
ncbi:hypothetical protein NHQ30_001071 [Ciborinia camelliae]|nr:hypothetical protein NHQ30_001071 [Ciborinia camelliae]